MTSSNGIFSAWLAICAGNSSVPGELPAQRPVTRSFDVFFDVRLKRRLSKRSWCWWFETLPCPLWRHSNGTVNLMAAMLHCGCIQFVVTWCSLIYKYTVHASICHTNGDIVDGIRLSRPFVVKMICDFSFCQILCIMLHEYRLTWHITKITHVSGHYSPSRMETFSPLFCLSAGKFQLLSAIQVQLPSCYIKYINP